MPRLLAIALVTGLVFPRIASLIGPLLYPSLFFIMLFSLMQIDIRETRDHLKRRTPLLLSIIGMQMIVLPVATAAASLLTPVDFDSLKYLLYATCASSIFGTPAFAKLLRLDAELALLGVILSTALLPFSFPLVWLLFFDARIDMDVQAYLMRLAVFVVAPAFGAFVYHRLGAGEWSSPGAPWLKTATVASLAVFAVAIMDGVTARFLTTPGFVLQLLVMILMAYAVLYSITYWIFRRIDASMAKTAGLLSAYRNLGLFTAVFGPFLGKEFLIFVGLWQIPMYLSPLVLEMALNRKSRRRNRDRR